jgi:regulator of protease activity HflC (stomatin/prohibitin superfamily)
MKKLFKSAILIASVALLAACSKVPAGNVGVKFDLYGGDKGVTGEVVGPGKYWLGWNEEMYLFPTFAQNYVWTADNDPTSPTDESITFQDREGTQIDADIGITYAIDAAKADVVFQKYRKGVDEITDTYLRNMVRDALNSETSKMDVSEVYGPGKEELMQRVTQRVQNQVSSIGILVEKIYWIGAMRLPPQITGAINAKIEATQKAQQRENELQTATAQAQIEREKARGEADAKVIAAEGEAKANKLVADSINPNLIAYIEARTWNGSRATVIGGGTPIVDTRK